MPDLSQLSNEVKGVPDQTLQNELQHPTGLVPGYIVLAEAQRRQLMRQAEQKQQAQGQSSSVYQDVIRNMMARQPPQGLPAPPAGMVPIGNAVPTPGATPPQNFNAPQAPRPMGMAKGGALHFQEGGSQPAANVLSGGEAYAPAFADAEQQYGLPQGLVRSMAGVESGFDPDVISGKRRSPKGAIGMMQFMPATAKALGVNPLNPNQSIYAAAQYLANMRDKVFGGDLDKAIMGYNTGPNNVLRGIIPKETRDYLIKVRGGMPQQAAALPARSTPAPAPAPTESEDVGSGGEEETSAPAPPRQLGGVTFRGPKAAAPETTETAETAKPAQPEPQLMGGPPVPQELSAEQAASQALGQRLQGIANPQQAASDPYAQSRAVLDKLLQESDQSKATIRQLQAQQLARAQGADMGGFFRNLGAGMAEYQAAHPYAGVPLAFAHGIGVAGQYRDAERQQAIGNYLALEREAQAVDQRMYTLQTAGWANIQKTGQYGPEAASPGPGWTFVRDPTTPGYGVWQPPAQMQVTPDMIKSGLLVGVNQATGQPWQAGDMISGQQALRIQAEQEQAALKRAEKAAPPAEQKTLDYYVKQVQQDAQNWSIVPTEWKIAVGQALADKGVDVKRLDAATREMQQPQDPAEVSRMTDLVQGDAKNWSIVQGNKGLAEAVRQELSRRGVNVAQLDAMSRQTALFAQTVQPHIQKTTALVDQLDKEGKLGPVMGRWEDFRAGKWGAGDPEYVALRNNINLLDSAVARIHGGARGGGSPQMIAYMHNMLSAKQMDAPTLRSALGVFGDWVNGYAGMAPKAGASSAGTAGGETGGGEAAPKATKRWDPATGKLVDIP